METYKLVRVKTDHNIGGKREYYKIKDSKGNDQYALSNFDAAINKLMEIREIEFSKLKKKCRVVIAGGRDITSYEKVSRIIHESGILDEMTELVHGDCRGVDRLADKFFKEKFPFIKVTSFPADWNEGKSAGPKRNEKMANYAAEKRGKLLLIWSGKSNGSADMKKKAQAANLEIIEVIV